MRVMVTGATGFVGQHVVNELLARGHSVVAIARDIKRAREMPWFDRVEFIQCDLHEGFKPLFQPECLPNAIVHLAWPGLPNYRDFFHISKNLPADLTFLEAAVNSGVPHLLVAGTCLEYGMQYGPLTEELETSPTTPYGFAKDALRKALQLLQKKRPFTLQWMRLFYMYGEGQNKNSLLAQLDRAIDEGQPVFNMSMGDQLRDYLPIQDVAKNFVIVLENPDCQGVINCCSGMPVSVLDLVQQRCREKASDIRINRGYYPYPDYEPLVFWGMGAKLSTLKAASEI
ncbi:NAD(P)-dependent oxidoreductase [Sulfuriferula sp.]|uniref:NAD-dependent epimerase/dehydratase family protein n=1 Tax=Sulfuriferula sp. TaxID=2025307 RepID=UPI002730C040|nr:NAD(P)-dependent oxidoreductase [Sulfuriferula sp.]